MSQIGKQCNKQTERFVGECKEMCPAYEIELRTSNRLVHKLEMIPGTDRIDESRMVKTFTRSAAGKSMRIAESLRPPEVLLKTVNYLLDSVVSTENQPWLMIYEYVTDRLRAVRQDMVVQNTSAAHWICILQPIVKFHAYASYRLCNESIRNYDSHLNNIHLQECLKRLLNMYDDCDRLYRDTLDTNEFLWKHRPFFEALYVILNLGNTIAIDRALNLAELWRVDLVKQSIKLSLHYLNGNFLRVCRLIKDLPPLLAAVASLHLPQLRRNALKVMSIAYNSKNISFPIDVISEWLLYDDYAEAIDECKYYGLEVQENGVALLKTSFSAEKLTVVAKHRKFVDEKLKKMSIPSLILYD